MIDPSQATWSVQLNADCPKCGDYIDLIDSPDFSWSKIDPCENGTERSKRLPVSCPECQHEFEVCCDW